MYILRANALHNSLSGVRTTDTPSVHTDGFDGGCEASVQLVGTIVSTLKQLSAELVVVVDGTLHVRRALIPKHVCMCSPANVPSLLLVRLHAPVVQLFVCVVRLDNVRMYSDECEQQQHGRCTRTWTINKCTMLYTASTLRCAQSVRVVWLT